MASDGRFLFTIQALGSPFLRMASPAKATARLAWETSQNIDETWTKKKGTMRNTQTEVGKRVNEQCPTHPFDGQVPLQQCWVWSGCWLTYPSEKYDFVSWDDDIPNWMEK